jgi:phenylpropionate dioxygenase-like ring-hydroxylating dioxygenase large terminal subunit
VSDRRPFLRNCWYAAAWDHEVGRTPLARTFLHEPVVLYRRADGRPVALADRCCHRALPLSLGSIEGDALRCGYHGLLFDASGACVQVPGQTAIPPGARVASYPVVDRYGWIWIWMGEAALADEKLLPNWWWMTHPEWRVVKGEPVFYVKCDYQLVTDNLLDLSHLTFVHAGNIGTNAVAETAFKTHRFDDGVRMTRWIIDSPPPPMYRELGRFTGNVDRWQIVETRLPTYTDVFAGCAVTGTGAPQGDRSRGVEFHNLNTATPETETTTHYFYAHARNFRLDDASVDEFYRRDFRAVFYQDVVILDAQQRNMERFAGADQIEINVDGPALTVRRLLNARIAEENRAAAAA